MDLPSPAVDVVYAIYTASEPEMRAEHLTKWLKTYHNHFSYELNVFGYDANNVYPFTKFQQEVRDLFPLGLTWAFVVSPVNLIILDNFYVMFDLIESPGHLVSFLCAIDTMAIRFVEFSNKGYKIRKILLKNQHTHKI